jgi:hypothetical protein
MKKMTGNSFHLWLPPRQVEKNALIYDDDDDDNEAASSTSNESVACESKAQVVPTQNKRKNK